MQSLAQKEKGWSVESNLAACLFCPLFLRTKDLNRDIQSFCVSLRNRQRGRRNGRLKYIIGINLVMYRC